MRESPTTDDRQIWDVWLSMWWLPSVTVADELAIFDALASNPCAASDLARALDLDERGVMILLGMLAALGFLVSKEGRFHISDVTRNFLLHDEPFYWGSVFASQGRTSPLHTLVRGAVKGNGARSVGKSTASSAVEAWKSGQLDSQQAEQIAKFMHSHSMPAAIGVARNGNFRGVSRLLDIGGGSGCFAIALVERHAHLRCTVMDLPAMCALAREYIAQASMADRVDSRAVDMFRDDWPREYDAVFFSNIFHDWSDETCAGLATRAYTTLPRGGRVYLHEMLLDDSGTGPRTATAFAMLMLVATRGRQFTYGELRTMLENAGFVDVDVTASYGYYSLITAMKR
jgi:hypothetical protein